jgi:glucokinase
MVADMGGGCVIGVDLGGTKLLAGVVDEALEVRHRAYRLGRGEETQEVIEHLCEVIAEVRLAAGEDAAAIGLGVPCLVDRERGVALSSNHLPLENVPIRDLVAERFDLPVFVDNDGNAAMLAEWRWGAASGAQDGVLLTLGTGIGGGILAEGALVRGSLGAAAELGHMVIDMDGPPCPGSCPNRGCLEAYVSGAALGREGLRVAHEQPDSALAAVLASGRRITGALVTEVAHDGDAAAREVVAAMGRCLGVGIASYVNIFNPEVVVVGGGAIAAGELLLAPAREVVMRRALPTSREAVRIVPARFGAESGMLGAAALAFEGLAARDATHGGDH